MAGRAIIFLLSFVFAAALAPAAVRAAEGVVLTQSESDVKTTMDRLQKVLTDKGVTIFARIDHAAGASSIGQTLRPMELLVFGNPKLGTPLMQKNPLIGLDLPIRVLVYQAENGTTYIAYTDPAYLSKRYGVTEPASTLAQMSEALKGFVAAAAK